MCFMDAESFCEDNLSLRFAANLSMQFVSFISKIVSELEYLMLASCLFYVKLLNWCETDFFFKVSIFL